MGRKRATPSNKQNGKIAMSKTETKTAIEEALNLLKTIEKREEEYRAINKNIANLQGDFCSHLSMIDGAIHHRIYKLLEAVFNCDIAEYYMLEARNMKGGGAIFTPDGKTWPIRNLDDIRIYINREQ